MKYTTPIYVTFLLVLIMAGCAQVPQESVELSTTLGRDIAQTQSAHREMAASIFTRMKSDINRFVDDVYAPHQIKAAMARQKVLADSDDPNDKSKSLLLAINSAFNEEASPELQEAVFIGMEYMIVQIRNDVEGMRSELLTPIETQEYEVLSSIDRAYQQMHYANSIVTGHLSSVLKIHNTQADMLNSIGLKRDLRLDIGQPLSFLSNKISSLTNIAPDASSVDESVDQLKKAVGEAQNIFSNNKNE